MPEGTIILHKTQIGGDAFIADLEQAGQQVVVAKGGEGGLGNTHFVSSTNQAPQIAQSGELGEEKSLILELRLIADVGVIGYPNVGKSTLLAKTSAAKPKIASYPFTTLEPALGVAEVGWHRLVLAEIPGLVDGAHLGRGLGHDFLRHITRTKVLIHLLDGTSVSPLEDMMKVNAELSLFDSALAKKPQVIAVNKIDLPEVRARLDGLEKELRNTGAEACFVSAATGEGVPGLIGKVAEMLQSVAAPAGLRTEVPKKVFRPQPRDTGPSVRKEGDTFVVEAPELERLMTKSDTSSFQVRGQLMKRLSRRGITRALEKAGIKPGDKVRCGSLEWEW